MTRQQGALWTQAQGLGRWKGAGGTSLRHLLLWPVLCPPPHTSARLACLEPSRVSSSSHLPRLTPFFSLPLDEEEGEGILMPILQKRRLSHIDAEKTGRDGGRADRTESWLWSLRRPGVLAWRWHCLPCGVGGTLRGLVEQTTTSAAREVSGERSSPRGAQAENSLTPSTAASSGQHWAGGRRRGRDCPGRNGG